MFALVQRRARRLLLIALVAACAAPACPREPRGAQPVAEIDKTLADFAALQAAAAAGDSAALLEALDHPALLLRHSAHEELRAMSGGGGATAGYDPFAARGARARAASNWRKLVAEGAVAGTGRVQLQHGDRVERPAAKPLSSAASAKLAVRVLDGLVASSGRVEAVDALVELLAADPKAARYALACLEQRTAGLGAPAAPERAGAEDDDGAAIEAFRTWWRSQGRQRFVAAPEAP